MEAGDYVEEVAGRGGPFVEGETLRGELMPSHILPEQEDGAQEKGGG